MKLGGDSQKFAPNSEESINFEFLNFYSSFLIKCAPIRYIYSDDIGRDQFSLFHGKYFMNRLNEGNGVFMMVSKLSFRITRVAWVGMMTEPVSLEAWVPMGV